MVSQLIFGALLVVLGLHCSNAEVKATVRIEPTGRELLKAEGSTLKMKCVAENHMNSGDQVTWSVPFLADVNKLSQRSEQMTGEGKYNSTVELTIESFSKDKEGEYACIYIAQDGSGQERASIIVKAVIESKPQPVYYFGNDSTLLYCDTGLEGGVKHVGWLKNGEPVEEKVEKYKLYKNGSLAIMNLDRDDAGRYIARYNLTSNSKTYDCVIDFKAGPLVLDMDKSINGEEEGSVEIKCEVKGWPHPQVTWLKGKEVVKPKDSSIKFSAHNGVPNAMLTLSSLEYEDEGMYTCRAYSKEFNETNEKSIKLRVKGKLEWLWPFLGIIIEAIVLVALVFLFEKIKKKGDSDTSNHAHQQ